MSYSIKCTRCGHTVPLPEDEDDAVEHEQAVQSMRQHQDTHTIEDMTIVAQATDRS
jgi:hypothetical protein